MVGLMELSELIVGIFSVLGQVLFFMVLMALIVIIIETHSN